MVYAIIAAGGIGSRMGNKELPKQYLMLNDQPIIVHTVKNFLKNPSIAKTIALCPQDWVDYTIDIFQKYLGLQENLVVISGGATRNDTIMNAIDFIENSDGLDDDTIILTHDAVRPFTSENVIDENIKQAKTHDAVGTFVPCVDTIISSEDGDSIDSIPDRSKLFNAQTPQTFKAKLLKEIYLKLSEDEKAILTDACKIFVLKGYSVKMVQGEFHNIKITYPYDMKVAKVILEQVIKTN